jgi:hypothetical protein
MRSYKFLVVLALAASTVSPGLSAPIQYGCGNLLVELKHWAYLISGISLGLLGRIPIRSSISMSFVVSTFLLHTVPTLLSMPTLPLPPKVPSTLPTLTLFPLLTPLTLPALTLFPPFVPITGTLLVFL